MKHPRNGSYFTYAYECIFLKELHYKKNTNYIRIITSRSKSVCKVNITYQVPSVTKETLTTTPDKFFSIIMIFIILIIIKNIKNINNINNININNMNIILII